MKLGIAVVVVAIAAAPAGAELAKLDKLALTDKVKKVGFAKDVTVLGCKGSVRHELDKVKVIGITFTANDKCDLAAVSAAIQKEYPGKPIVSSDGKAKLWEGKTSSILLLDESRLQIRLITPGAGSKRPCFADDGFATFFQSFKNALAGNKADAVAAMVKFPLKDFEDKVFIKDAKTFVKKFDETFDESDRKEAADLTAACDIREASYEVQLPNSNIDLEARQIDGQWKWAQISFRSTD